MITTPAWARSLHVGLLCCLLASFACTDPPTSPFRDGDSQTDERGGQRDMDAAMDEASDPIEDSGPEPEPDATVADGGTADATMMDDDDAGEDMMEDPPPLAECPDADGDGHRDAACGGDDCDDSDDAVHPGAFEVCANGVDDDCNPTTSDTGDNDRDGYACELDCDDGNARVNPGRAEVCDNGADDDCDATTPDRFDMDGDGATCEVDCNDDDPNVKSGATEVCGNGVDDDCDPSTPDVFDADDDRISCLLDCDDRDPSLPDAGFYCGSVYSYHASFDSSDEGWVASEDSSWDRGAPRNRKFMEQAGRIGWFTQDSGSPQAVYQRDEQSTLTSPSLDFRGLSRDPVLQFDRIRSFNNGGVMQLEVSIDGGFVWTRAQETPLDRALSDRAPGNTPEYYARSATPAWARARTLLTGTAGESDVRLRFRFSTGGATPDAGFGLDNVSISSHAFDAAVVGLTVIHDGCGGNRVGSVVSVQVQNLSSQPISNVPVSYQLGGELVDSEMVPGPIGVGETVLHTFSESADVSPVGTHEVQAWVALPGDRATDNDRATKDTHTFPVLAMGDYLEDFEQDGGEWYARGIKTSWARGIPIGDRIDGAASGDHAWVTNPLGAHNPQEQSILTGPCWDFSAASGDPELLFALAYDLDDVNGRGTVELSTDGGNSFALLNGDPASLNWYNDGSDLHWTDAYPSQIQRSETHTWHTARHKLVGAAGQDLVQIRFRLDIGGSTVGPGMAIDDVQVLTETEDVAVVSLASRPFRCGGEPGQTVTIDVRNDGNQPVSNVQVSYRVDGGTPVAESIPGPIDPGAVETHVFSTLLATPAAGAHTLSASATTASDFFPDNDSREMALYAVDTHALPYQESFEQDDGNWVAFGDNSTWQWGVPKTLDFRGPRQGDHVWATNLTGDASQDESSHLLSPCFDVSGLGSDPVLSLVMAREIPSGLRAQVEMTSDGETWSPVGMVGSGRGWHNYSFDNSWSGSANTGWTNAVSDVAGIAGGGLVQFRLTMFDTSTTSTSSVADGVAIDEFLFAEDYVDASITGTSLPASLCGPGHVGIEVTNDGSEPLSNIPVSYVLDGGTPVNEVLAGPIDPGMSELFTFATPYTLTPGMTGNLQVLVEAPGDVRPGNDAAVGMSTGLPSIVGAGYAEDFEASDGGWQAGGQTSWAWATPDPTNPHLSSAGSGSRAWFTNPSGDYGTYEDGFIESPCFDFSAEANDPLLSLDLIFDTELSYDGAWIEVSYDSGVTWTPLGVYGDPTNWYTVDRSQDWWAGASNGDSSWIQASHTLDGAAGMFGRIRVRFFSNSSWVYEGVGVDTIAIAAQ